LRMCVPEPCSRAFLLRIDIVRRVSMRRADWKALIAAGAAAAGQIARAGAIG